MVSEFTKIGVVLLIVSGLACLWAADAEMKSRDWANIAGGSPCHDQGCAKCGNGILEPDEECEPVKANNSDSTDEYEATDDLDYWGRGCDKYCRIITGYRCVGMPSVCGPIWNDGYKTKDEECDDGNEAPDDGCHNGFITDGYACSGKLSVCHLIVCGDGYVDEPEECDGGSPNGINGCQYCRISSGYWCELEPSVCHYNFCGDGYALQDREDCDDGNQRANDGCSTACEIEPGFICVVNSIGTSRCDRVL